MFKKKSKNYKLSPDKIFNMIMTIVAIIFIAILFFKYGYNPATDMIIDNSSTTINIQELKNSINNSNTNIIAEDEY